MTDKCKAYQDGLKEGRDNNYKKTGTVGTIIDALTGAHNPPIFSGLDEDEKNAWRDGYKHGKWED
jgi:hypothetical protein